MLPAFLCFGQTPLPDITYILHAQPQVGGGRTLVAPEPYRSSALALAPNNSLIVLIPQGLKRFLLKRLTGWDTQAPHEDTISIESGTLTEKYRYFSGEIRVNPSGTYLVVRLVGQTLSFSSDSYSPPPAVVILVDMNTFKIVWRRVIHDDPLIGDGFWRFNKEGLLVSKGTVKHAEQTSPDLLTYTDTLELGVLRLPGLEPVESCQYTEISKMPLHGDDVTTRSEQADADCAAVLQAAGVSSVENFTAFKNPWRSIDESINPGSTCFPIDLNQDETRALYHCGTARQKIFDTHETFRNIQVISVLDGKPVLTVPLAYEDHFVEGLAKIRDQEYLLVLQNGVKLYAYRLPK
jgi:hypothetical protein